MATAEELLNSISKNQVSVLSEDDGIFVIDGESRTITVPDSERLFGVEGDKDVERKYFQCPKIVGDNIDLSQHQIYVSYVFTTTENNTIFPTIGNGLYHCEDVEVSGDNITFSWLLSGNVFANPGFIAFKVMAKKSEGSELKTKWNTAPAIGTVLLTVPDGEEIAEEYPDIINQLLTKMESVEQIATPEAMQEYVNAYLEENPVTGGMTAEQEQQLNKNTEDISSLSTDKIDNPEIGAVGQLLAIKSIDESGRPTEYEPIDAPETDTSKLENAVFGESLELPGVIDKADYILSGNPILLYKGDSLLSPDMFVNNGSAVYDAYTGLLSNAGNLSFAIAKHVPIDRTKTYYFRGIGSNACVIYGTNNVSSAFGTILLQINSGGSVSASTLDRYEYYNLLFKTTITSGNAVMYFGESPEKDTVVSSEYNIKSTDYVGYYMLNSENASAKTESISDGITPTMPSAKSSLLVNKDLKLTKYATPFRFRNNYSYLDNGENSYFCWNHNMLQYDKTLHRYVYICKNKSTHTSSGNENEYMYIIDPANPLSAKPQRIYTENGDQIKWCQGFAIMDDGIWVLADCSVENYDAPQMIISKNNGSTFEILCEFVPPIDSGYFNSISVGFNGRIFGAYDDGTVSISSSNSHIAYSDDSGRTWNDIEITSQKFAEQLILPISETRLALIGRYNAYNSYEQMAVTAYSDDNGLTWTFFNSGMKMHCNDCAGFMHDDLLELFCLERYYKNSFRVGDMTGQLTHYVGSADNFVNNEMIELETFYLTGYDSADLGHPSACMDEYGGAMVITSANHERAQNNTYPLIMWADCNRNPV